MQILLKSLFFGALAFTLVYLIGVFIQADFNIRNWDEAARVLVGIFGGGCAIVITGASIQIQSDEKR